ncbi:NAD(P)H-dependent oxidoreductase subunit E [Candidatus Kuenenia sp.]|uniref:NADH-quinone oxidoreductase subunit NuoE family protein n=1 Tax=Candidatus Kuenenia sp. TaxID=2499824 RepID=UPI003220717A
MPDEANSLSVNLDKCHSILSRAASNDLIPILQEMQEEYGYLPMAAMEEVSVRTGIPLSRIYGVVTFYAQFSLVPRGKHTIRLCAGTACHIKGAPDIGEKIADVLQVEEGETTPDYKFTHKTVACLGTCFLAPVMMIDDRYYGKLTEEKTEEILKSY